MHDRLVHRPAMIARAASRRTPGPPFMSFQYIAIEGPIGVGKTSLAERLATRLDATTILEERENPFLADFYGGRPGVGAAGAAVLPAQPPPAAAVDAAGRSVRAVDGQRLPVRQGQDLRVSESRRQRALHLPASLRSAVEGRARARSRRSTCRRRPRCWSGVFASARATTSGTRSTPIRGYLKELNEAYQHFFFHYTATPLLVVETSQLDLTGSDEALDDLIKQINRMGRGTQYYVPRT